MSDCVNGNTCSHKCDNDVIKLSVVVPVYNAGKYLRPCLDSLVNQNVPQETYEVICVMMVQPMIHYRYCKNMKINSHVSL
ncbi:MAG: glycosyltransferase [Clostridia bacterium]|nr:glycosyltransferase [Clostridia bacterium]